MSKSTQFSRKDRYESQIVKRNAANCKVKTVALSYNDNARNSVGETEERVLKSAVKRVWLEKPDAVATLPMDISGFWRNSWQAYSKRLSRTKLANDL